MAVDSVNNNRTTAVVTGSLLAGAAAGAGLGYANTKILEGDAPKDSFIKTFDNNVMSHAKKVINQEFDAYKKLAETGNLEDIKNAEIKEYISEQLKDGGVDPAKATKEQIQEFAKAKDVSDTARNAALKKLDGQSISNLEKNARSFEKIELPKKGAKLEEYKKIFKDNHKLFGIEVKDGSKVDDAVSTFVKDKFNNNLAKMKAYIVSEKDKSKNILNSKRTAQKAIFADCYDIAGKKMKELPKDATEEVKAGFKVVKDSIRNFKLSAAAKWGAAGAAALGLTSFVTAKLAGGKGCETVQECDCEDCHETEEA